MNLIIFKIAPLLSNKWLKQVSCSHYPIFPNQSNRLLKHTCLPLGESQTLPGGFFDDQQSFEGFAILRKLGKLAETITYIKCRRIANPAERGDFFGRFYAEDSIFYLNVSSTLPIVPRNLIP